MNWKKEDWVKIFPKQVDKRALGIIVGSIGIIAAIIFQLVTVDPTETSRAH